MGKTNLVESGRVCSTKRVVPAEEIFNSDGTVPQERFAEIAKDTALRKLHFVNFESDGGDGASGSYWIVKFQKTDETTFAIPADAVN